MRFVCSVDGRFDLLVVSGPTYPKLAAQTENVQQAWKEQETAEIGASANVGSLGAFTADIWYKCSWSFILLRRQQWQCLKHKAFRSAPNAES